MSSKNRIIKSKTSPGKGFIQSKKLDKKPTGVLEITQNSFKTPEKYSSPLRVLTKPDESKSEILAEILKRRNMLEESLLKIQKNYSMKEVQLFEKIGNEEEIKLLVALRPGVLNSLDKQVSLKKREEEKKNLSNKQGRHRRLVSKGSNDFSEKSNSVASSSRSNYLNEGYSSIVEGQIRENLQKVYKGYEEILLHNLESTFQSTLEENRLIIEDYWTTVIEKLENKLASLAVVTEESDQEPEKLEYIEELASEIEERIRKEYKNKSRYSKGIPKKEKENCILKLQAELEIEQINSLETEKNRWKNQELAEVQNECKERLWLEHEDILLRKEIELRRQAELELQEIISNLVKDTNLAVSSKAKVIIKEKESQRCEFEEICKDEGLQELVLEEADQLRNQLVQVLSKSIYKELKENFYPQIEIDLKLKNEEKIKREINLGFQEAFENYRQRLEKENVNKMIEIECQFETNRSEVVKKSFEEKFVKVEKELKIGYLRKIDKLKNIMRKEFEESYCAEFKKLKNELIKEKCEAGQIKAQINVLLSKVSAEKQAFLQEKNNREEQFSRLSRDISAKKLREFDQSQLKSSPEYSNSPLKRASLFQVDAEISSILPRPLPPPALNQSMAESRVMSVSPQRKLLKHYNTKEIVNDIIMKNHEHLNSQQRICRVLETPVRPKSTIPFIPDTYSTEKSAQIKETPVKKSLYAELLHKKYGILEPRYKNQIK